ncbi:MAG TPA: SDR family oxidoreductase [Chthoniobacteraceae bacterium]|nr:SDR family oxidoreductase [Chthoniobacteraceae bacterium]
MIGSGDLGLAGKVALVTGSASGIGEAIVRRLAAEGARVIVHGRPSQQHDAEKIATEIGPDAAVQMASLEDPAECARLVEWVVAQFGTIDILVNNAAICTRARLPDTDAALFDQVIAVDVRAPLLLIRAALPHFRKQKCGRVLNIGSVNAYCGEAALVAYAIAKAGLTTMTRNLADAHGAEGIRINQLNPGWVLTPAEYAIKVREGLSKDWPNQIPREHAPGGRIFDPAEIAHFAAAFLGEPAALVNGSVVDIEQFPMVGRLPVKASGF